MWLLESDDREAFGGTRMWLRPGCRCVLGRVKQGDVTHLVPSNKTISRTHLIINIADVNQGDGLKILTRTQVTIQDNNTKYGTTVNGDYIKGSFISLGPADDHTFYLGKHQQAFRLKWMPVIFSFSLNSKERRVAQTVMAPYRAQVETLDIKTIPTWTDSTTHVVAKKRNTAIGLQALVNSRYIVTSSYLDAIARAATVQPTGPTGGQPMSPLEIDFDANWPKPEDFLPPASNEPITLLPGTFSPNPRRKSLFDGWVFVFCEDVQYQSLLGPITDAQGKAEKFVLKPKVTLPKELADFVQKRGGGSEAALIQFRTKDEPDWESEFSSKVEELLGYKMVGQNEFLQIILSCETTALRKPVRGALPTAWNGDSSNKVTASAAKPREALSITGAASLVPGRVGRARRRGITPIDLFAFDIDGEFLPAPTPGPATQTQAQSSESKRGQSIGTEKITSTTSNASHVLLAPMEIEETSQPSSPAPLASPRKRRAPPAPKPDLDEDLDVMDLLPGSKIVKRRRIAEEEQRARRGNSITMSETNIPAELEVEKTENTDSKGKGKKKAKPETSFEMHAREIREQDAEQVEKAKAEEKSMMDGINIEKLKNLAIIEVMRVKPKDRLVRDAHGDGNAGWKPEWDGRKNFKKFRRSGRGSTTRLVTGPKVFIDLVETKNRDYGIGDGYWIENGEDNGSRKRNSQRNTQASNTPADTSLYSTALETAEPSEAETLAQRGHTQASSSRLASLAKSQGTKRPSSAQSVRSRKKQKDLQLMSDSKSSSEDSDDDDLKFKLPKRRRQWN